MFQKTTILLALVFSLFLCTAAHAEIESKLVGTWKGNVLDFETEKPVGSFTMQFKEDGTLILQIKDSGAYTLAWRVEGNVLISSMDGEQDEDRVVYRMEGNTLIFEENGEKNILVRQE